MAHSTCYLCSAHRHEVDENLTVQVAAQYTNQSERTIRRRIADGSLPAYRVGPRAIRIKRDDLDQLLQPVPTVGGEVNA